MSIRHCARTMKHAVLIAAMLAAATSASLAAAEKRQFEVAAGSAVQTLNEFSRQANIQLLFDSDAVRSFQTQAVSGDLEVADALAQLLGGTSLVFEFVNERTVAVMLRGARPRSQRTSSAGRTNEEMRLAQAETGVAAGTAEPLSERRIELEEIIVTGTNIRGVYPSSSPVEIYTAEDIARSGATTTEQFVQKLPQNLAYTSSNAPSTVAGVADANREAVSSPDLRGLGVGTTLTLLNGRRMGLANLGRGADISSIPVSAVARVEVLTDGASAIYGSDAIGGVINFVLRDDFEGAETALHYGGVTSGNLRHRGLSQTFGHAWTAGHGLISYDFYDASALKSIDRPQLFAADSIAPTNLTPIERRNSVLGVMSHDLGERLSLDANFLLSWRDVESSAASSSASANNYSLNETKQAFVNVGANYAVTEFLRASLIATHTEVDVDSTFVRSTPFSETADDSQHTALNLTTMVDGRMFQAPAGDVRFVLGGDWLDEGFQSARSALTGDVARRAPIGRISTALFGELLLPLIGADQNVPFVKRLQLSLAGRYTRHEDDSDPAIEGDFDGFSPKIGLSWSPVNALNVRATWGESFRAPTVSQTDPSGGLSYVLPETAIGGVQAVYLVLDGPAPGLEPETAETRTVGFDFTPQRLPGLRLSATYFDIDYADRIRAAGIPAGSADAPTAWLEIWSQPASAAEIERLFASNPLLVNLSDIEATDPQALSQALIDRLPAFWIADARIRNLSLSRMDGLDLNVSYRAPTSWGEISVGSDVSRIFSYDQQLSSSSPVVSALNSVLQPVDLRARAFASISIGEFSNTLNVRYVDEYGNPFARDANSPRRVGSWTTVDWNASYRFASRDWMGPLASLRLSLGVQNVFDKDPPFVFRTSNAASNLVLSPGYDPANANPLGRVVSLGVTAAW